MDHRGEPAGLLRPEVDELEVAEVTKRAAPSIGFYAAATALAIVPPRVAAVIYLVIGVQGVCSPAATGPAPGEPEPD